MTDIEEPKPDIFEKVFKITDNGTTVRTEVLSGLTTFMAMAYIVVLNPYILSGNGLGRNGLGSPELKNGIFLATCFSSAIASLTMGFLANKPYCLAPGMGLNTFTATTVVSIMTVSGMGYDDTFRAMLCVVLIEGIIFLLLSIFNIREKILDAIPRSIRYGISPSIGLMLINIGFGSNVTIFNSDGESFYVLRDFFGSLTANYIKDRMGDAYGEMVLSVLTMFVGIFFTIILAYKRIKGSVVIGMMISSIFYWVFDFIILEKNPFLSFKSDFLPKFGDLFGTTFFRFNFSGLFNFGWLAVITFIITFVMIDMFDTLGTTVGTAHRHENMIDKAGRIINIKEVFISDSIGTIVGSCLGTSTVTTYIESASGIEAGGRTGLTAVICALCFLFTIFLSPVTSIIPAPATSSALIYVGVLMGSSLKDVDFTDLSTCVPVIIMLITMPISGSIGHGIGLALISYSIIKVCVGESSDVPVVTYIISVIFIIKFFLTY